VGSQDISLWPELGRNVHRRAPAATQGRRVRHGLKSGEVRDKALHDGAWEHVVGHSEVSDELV
jgi:hypothetical protein